MFFVPGGLFFIQLRNDIKKVVPYQKQGLLHLSNNYDMTDSRLRERKKESARMIIKMTLEHAVVAFVETLLPRGSDLKQVLQMSFDIRARKPEGGKEVQHCLHLLFHRPGNYTKVLWNITNNGKRIPKDFAEWKVESDHDSGWITDGLSTPLFNLGCEMVKKIDQTMRPIDCEVLANFSLDGRPKLVSINSYQYDRNARKFIIEW